MDSPVQEIPIDPSVEPYAWARFQYIRRIVKAPSIQRVLCPGLDPETIAWVLVQLRNNGLSTADIQRIVFLP